MYNKWEVISHDFDRIGMIPSVNSKMKICFIWFGFCECTILKISAHLYKCFPSTLKRIFNNLYGTSEVAQHYRDIQRCPLKKIIQLMVQLCLFVHSNSSTNTFGSEKWFTISTGLTLFETHMDFHQITSHNSESAHMMLSFWWCFVSLWIIMWMN